ncbi:hypothetical protein [Mycobacterium antarcticum]|nr:MULTISPECIES: hypothetical protein [unclassified Mycolicibacterium]
MTEPRSDERQTDANDETEPVTGPGGDSPDPEFGDDPTIPDQTT